LSVASFALERGGQQFGSRRNTHKIRYIVEDRRDDQVRGSNTTELADLNIISWDEPDVSSKFGIPPSRLVLLGDRENIPFVEAQLGIVCSDVIVQSPHFDELRISYIRVFIGAIIANCILH